MGIEELKQADLIKDKDDIVSFVIPLEEIKSRMENKKKVVIHLNKKTNKIYMAVI